MMRGDDKYKHPIGALFDVGDGRRLAGHLKLKRGDLLDSNIVSLVGDEIVHIRNGGSLHGDSVAGKISLLDCVSGVMTGGPGCGDFTIPHGDICFRYALFGTRHVAADENCIRGIEFTLEGVESSVFTQDKFERFGHLREPDDEILDAIERKRPDFLPGDFVKGQAMVSYFTGRWDYLRRFKTVLGTVHVGRSMQFDIFGRGMEDTPRLAIDFDDDPKTLEGAWEKMREVRQFFAWMMGYAPAWKDVVAFTSELKEDGFRDYRNGHLEVFGPNEWKEVPENARRCGPLIDASGNPEHFVQVMGKWLERNADPKRKKANMRFFGSIQGMSSRVMEDGIVSAANTFDLLPDEDKPGPKPLAKDVLEILEEAASKVKDAMDDGPSREDVLNSLGSIRKNKRLRDIVEHRAAVVWDYFGRGKLADLECMIRLAVQCRNYYTHGGDERNAGAVDFWDFDVVHFLTQTLEFIYGASELLECGWDAATSIAVESHPIGGYVGSYDRSRSMVFGHHPESTAGRVDRSAGSRRFEDRT